MYRIYENAIMALVVERHLAGRNEGEYCGAGRQFRNEAIVEFCFGRIWKRGYLSGQGAGYAEAKAIHGRQE